MALPLVNGRAYDYVQITVGILGVPVPGISSINYTEEQEVMGNKGTGKYDVSVGEGGITAQASMDISMNDVEALRDVAPERGSLLSIPYFDVVVVFGNIQGVQTHTVRNCKFKNDGVETTEGDTDIKRTFDLYCSHIDYR